MGKIEVAPEAFRVGALMDIDGETYPGWKERAKVLVPSFWAEEAKVTEVQECRETDRAA